MQEIERFSLETHTGPYESWPLVSELMDDGVPTGCRIPGYVIERQYACGQNFLLITSYDCPFEEAQNFLLLDSAFQIIAKKFLGVAYDTYRLIDARPIADDVIEIVFDGDDRWRLQIRDRSRLFFPRLKLCRVR